MRKAEASLSVTHPQFLQEMVKTGWESETTTMVI